ncbi:MAG: NADPH-dependent oxidoreductase [Proteobacteria bacterium]|nr:MAG: NADPH-dependent oxidoreductase [Pseudomonadota bacterium]
MTTKNLYQARYGAAPDFEPSDNATLRGILTRRSCREFASQPVDPDLLRTLLAAAFSAPSKSDLQQATVIRVTDPGKRARIAGLNARVGWIAHAPEFMVWCGDSRRIRRLSQWKGRAFANDHLDAFMNAAVDAAIAMQTFIVAAESVGLGCCPVSEIRDSVEALSSELSLANHVFPVAGLCVGWPATKGSTSMRLPLSVTVHENRYDDRALLEETEAYDHRRELAAPTPPDRQREVDRFGISDNYGWSEHRTRQYSRPMRTDFGAYIRKQGFNLK